MRSVAIVLLTIILVYAVLHMALWFAERSGRSL